MAERNTYFKTTLMYLSIKCNFRKNNSNFKISIKSLKTQTYRFIQLLSEDEINQKMCTQKSDGKYKLLMKKQKLLKTFYLKKGQKL